MVGKHLAAFRRALSYLASLVEVLLKFLFKSRTKITQSQARQNHDIKSTRFRLRFPGYLLHGLLKTADRLFRFFSRFNLLRLNLLRLNFHRRGSLRRGGLRSIFPGQREGFT